MAQYEQGPEAKAVQEGFALQELFNREQGINKRAAAEQTFRRGMADVDQAHALDRMVKGEDLKEQGAQRDAERTAPFLRTLISGNPNVAKTFGFGQDVTTPGELPAPEAGYAGTEAKTTFQPRQPTMAEATGLSRAVPGIAQTLLQKSMDPTAGFTLAPGQIRFNAQGQEVARGGPMDIGMTLEEAQAVKKKMEEQDPTNVGRVQLQSHEKGGWTVSLASQTPLTPPDPIKKQYDEMIKNNVDPKVSLDWYIRTTAEMAGAKQLSVSINTPPVEAALQGDAKQQITQMAFNNLMDMQNVAPAMVQEFLTWKGSAADLYNKFSRIPGMQYLVGPQGFDQEQFVQKYNNWKADLGRIQGGSFDIGGKQLTPFENEVVLKSIPSDKDSPQAYSAKMRWLGSYIEAQRAYVAWSRVTPKGAQTAEAQNAMWAQLRNRSGINPAQKDDWLRNLSPDDRLRHKVNN